MGETFYESTRNDISIVCMIHRGENLFGCGDAVTEKEGKMKRCKLLPFLLISLVLALVMAPATWAQERPLIIGFEGDAATLDPHARSETTTTTMQRHV